MSYRITGYTRLIGLLGYPIRHSRSPHMHNSSFRHLGLDFVYLVFEVDNNNLEDAINAMRTLDVTGFNVTMPNKQKVIPLLDELSVEAKIIGAVNTVHHKDGKLIGYNTDGKGFVDSLNDQGIDPKGKTFCIVGAGGAGTAVSVQLALDGAGELRIFTRRPEQGEALVKKITDGIPGANVSAFPLDMAILKEKCSDADVFVQTTGVGMGDLEDQSVVSDPTVFHENLAVVDIIYSPANTRLMKMAKEAGCKQVFNGLGMMLGQGALAFNIWTGEQMPIEFVKEELGLE